MAAWIKMIADDEADETLKPFFDRVRTPHGTVDNVMRAHSLRPHTMDGHVVLYRSVLHNPDNTLPFWFLEVVASYVSILNNCDYSLSHHFTNARRLIGDDARADAVRAALDAHRPEDAFDGKELALLVYAGKLTTEVGAMAETDIGAVRAASADDGEILEVNQVCAYFNYSNRLLNGLGVTTEGDIIGYYKEMDADT
ncbi:MAG: peroxidase-related enzyme [Alphaproteobacteria bacterium]|nr:peroxidase-related enzyme [Alphaproteobacteria bacterium]